MRPNVGYTSESRVADRIPMADLSTRKMTKDTEEGGRPPNLMVVRDLYVQPFQFWRDLTHIRSHSKSPRDFQSGAMSELTSRSSPPLSEDSSKALSSSSGRDENISTSHHSSSLSQTSSKVSDSAAREATPNKDPNTLEGVLNDELRTEPAVAKLLYRSLVGKLEYAPPGAEVHIFDDGNSHSILSLLTIRDPRPIKHRGAFTYAPTTASGSSYSSSSKSPTGAKASLSGSGSSGGKGLTSSNDGSGKDTANDGIHGQSTKQQKSKTKSNASTSNNIQSLRCFHNISLPETFCVNHKTRDRFRSCGGPGFNNIQRLREHMASHHKQKPDELKCSGCKQDFANPKSLKEHTDTTDCVICCPDCNETFFKKTDRTAHQNANHSDGGKSVFYKELDEKLWEKLKDALKTFAISIQRGKASEDPSLAKWVEKNKERYMIGRSSNANYLLELGQWYVAWDTLRPLLSEEYVPEHPFYDYLPAAELGEEKIRLVFKQLVAGEIKVNGPPPNEIPTQITWYDHHLGKALRIASRTQLKMNSKPQYDDDTYDSLPNSSLPQQTAFDSQVPIAQFNISTTMQGEAPITYQPPLGMMNQRAHNMVHPTQGFYPIPGHQQQAVTMQNMPSVPSSSTDGMFWDGQPPHPESAVKLRRRR
ncbi:hypothetical protein BJ875DRAFT_454239 [Amylocarpus encephaloides]|uniref:C2H2-type domain-containing protein n=1 Tax=Amylocarpus encephaloides TaxID=45428 RepID=A0A9P7YQH6_9HELO|nr:hypothetical protein BJ875DRAFT_454239 [Amylocarpus encephaloides]